MPAAPPLRRRFLGLVLKLLALATAAAHDEQYQAGRGCDPEHYTENLVFHTNVLLRI